MKRSIHHAAICLVAVGMSVGMAYSGDESDAAQVEPVRIRVDLADGSSVFGLPAAAALPVSTRYGWKLEIPFEWISSVVSTPGTNDFIVNLRGGDRLTVQMRRSALRMATLIGEIKVEMEHIASMTVVTDQAALPPSLRKGLLAYYTFNRDEGLRVRDHSGAGREGAVEHAVWTPHGKIGGAMRFMPGESRIVAADEGLPMGNAPRSMAFWVKLGEERGGDNTIIAYGSMRHNQFSVLGMDWRVGRNSMAFSQHGAVNVAQTKFESDRWYHVVYTYGGRNEHAFYINGVAEPLAAREINMPLATLSSGRLYLGSVGDGFRSFDGWLDEIMIYDRALSPAEALQIFELR